MCAELSRLGSGIRLQWEHAHYGTASALVRGDVDLALLPRFAIQHDLDSGEMVIPCDVPIRTGNRFIMTWQEDKAESRHLQVFREWLLQKSVVSAA